MTEREAILALLDKGAEICIRKLGKNLMVEAVLPSGESAEIEASARDLSRVIDTALSEHAH